jgi:uncharacterized protein YggU (UPF0235/DUF167 family)
MADVRISIIAKPGSRTPGIAVSDRSIVVAVREHAREGAANDACRRALAKALGVAPSRVVLRSGARSKHKVFDIEGVTQATVVARLVAAAS